MSDKARKSRMFWVVGDGDVRYLKCWECRPNDGVWWCPEAGFSASEKYHFFKDEESALAKLIANLAAEKAEIEIALNKAIKRLNAL
jgi:hypothetical protein